MVNKHLIGLTITIAVLVGSVSLLQLHGIIFWQEKVGGHGWAWSILLEIVALWLWYRPTIGFRTLALVASILTLAGPIYQVAKPSFIASYEAGSTVVSNETALTSLISEKERLESQLQTYQENSSKRTGWLAPIQEANSRLIEIDRQLVELQQSTDAESRWFFSWAILMEVCSLILFQIVAVLSITSISRKVREMEISSALESDGKPLEEMETFGGNQAETAVETKESVMETPLKTMPYESSLASAVVDALSVGNQEFPYRKDTFLSVETSKKEIEAERVSDLEPLTVLKNLEDYLADKNMNFKEFGLASGVSAKELSFLRNHKKRLEAGERTVSIPALEKINSIIFEQA